MNPKFKNKLKSFSEAATCIASKIDEEVKPAFDEFQEVSEESEIQNFSIKSKSKLRKLLRAFSDLGDNVDDASIEADELEEIVADMDNFSLNRKARLIKKSFADLKDEFEKVNEEMQDAAEIAANDIGTNVPVSKNPEETVEEKTAGVNAPESVNEKVETGANDEDAAKLNIKTDVEKVNFSKLIKSKYGKLVKSTLRFFSEFEDAVDLMEDFAEAVKVEMEKTLVDPDGEQNKIEEANKDKVDEAMNKIPDEVSADAVKLENFCEELADKTADLADISGLDDKDSEKIQEAFCELGDALDEVVADPTSEKVDAVIEKVEFCKDCINSMSKKVKFSYRRKFCDVVKQFADLDPIMDKITTIKIDAPEKVLPEDGVTIEEAIKEFCDDVDSLSAAQKENYCKLFCDAIEKVSGKDLIEFCDTVDDKDEQINEILDEVENIEDKIADERLANFSKKLRKAIKARKCFSESEIEEKLDDAKDLVDDIEKTLESQDEEHPEDCDCDECKVKKSMCTEPSEEIAKADADLNDATEELESAIDEKIEDETIKNFAKKAIKMLKSRKCFSEEEIEEKSDDLEEITDMIGEFCDEVPEETEEVEQEEVVEDDANDESAEEQETDKAIVQFSKTKNSGWSLAKFLQGQLQ